MSYVFVYLVGSILGAAIGFSVGLSVYHRHRDSQFIRWYLGIKP